MDELIEALLIFRKYGNPGCPTHCEHDTLWLCMSPDGMSEEDIEKLDTLGFHVDEDDDCFKSYRFGSA